MYIYIYIFFGGGEEGRRSPRHQKGGGGRLFLIENPRTGRGTNFRHMFDYLGPLDRHPEKQSSGQILDRFGGSGHL